MKIIDGVLIEVSNEDIVDGYFKVADEIKRISKNAFYENSSLVTIDIGDNVTIIDDYAFSGCTHLKKIKIPKFIKYIGKETFKNCQCLEEVVLNDELKSIGYGAFQNCYKLKEIDIPDSVEVIKTSAFSMCLTLNDIHLGESLRIIEDNAFSSCDALGEIKLPNSIERLGDSVFSHCNNLESVILGKNINSIGEMCFQNSGLKEIVIPKKVKTIGASAFEGCDSLEKVDLNEGLEIIDEDAFCSCSKLRKLNVPKTVKKIELSAFSFASAMKSLEFNDGLHVIGDASFEFCYNLETISIPKSVKVVESEAFSNCANIQSFIVYSDTVIEPQILETDLVIINNETGEQRTIFVDMYREIGGNDGIIINKNGKLSFFDSNNNWITIEKEKLDGYNRAGKIKLDDYRKLYEWVKRGKFIPHHTIIENMPINQIDNFYINNNAKKWGTLLDLASIVPQEEKIGFFKLCYVLGLFEKSGKVSDRAYEFIKNNIVKDVSSEYYHVNYGGLDIKKNLYNDEFAQLVFKYYKKEKSNEEFLTIIRHGIEKVSYFAAIYNNFDQIKDIYPNKRVKTNRLSEELTPNMCIDAVAFTRYRNVKEENEEFAYNIGMYGYTQEEFERAQKLFDEGKNIFESDQRLFANKDINDKWITYELLDKDNPLGVILGDITNCCQTLNGTGRECLEYGLSMRNSKFMVFRLEGKIIGQSWVWYDEETYRICLDNIEVPKTVLEQYFKDDKFGKEFIGCLKRVVKGFLGAMKEKNLKVSSITIGEGFNDIKYLLVDFPKLINQQRLSGYGGYSDASNQYVLYTDKAK